MTHRNAPLARHRRPIWAEGLDTTHVSEVPCYKAGADTWNIRNDWRPWRQRAIVMRRLALGSSAQAVLARAEDDRL